MNTHNPFVCVVDDDALIRESLWNLFRSARTESTDICFGTGVSDQPAFGKSQLYRARCTNAGNNWS